MKKLFIVALICSQLACNDKTNHFHMPAEWEPHAAVWLGWEDENTSFHPSQVAMIKALLPHVQVKICTSSDSMQQVAKLLLSKNGIDTGKLLFHSIPGNRYWIRDHGATFLVNGKGELAVADFKWDFYGYTGWIKEKYDNNADSFSKYIKPVLLPLQQTGRVDSLMAVAEKVAQLPVDIIHEGGSIEVNGKGTLILCEAVVFQRNPGKTKEAIEKAFKAALGVTHIIWMKSGLADDPHVWFRRIEGNYIGMGTGGHTDEFVRFVNPNTVLLAWVEEHEKDANPLARINYERMSENYRILSQAKDQDGKPLNIIKVPLPDLIVKKIQARDIKDEEFATTYDVSPFDFKKSEAPGKGDSLLRVPASSYLNYLVTNGVVLMPTYVALGSSAEKERRVIEIIQKQFPDRVIKLIDAMPINWWGGGIHCSTLQQPVSKK